MHALIAFDKFKDSLTALQACQIAEHALNAVQPSWTTQIAPLADGGDGFVDTLTRYAKGSLQELDVKGPLLQPTSAAYGLCSTENVSPAALERLDLPPAAKTLAIIELAQSSGIALLSQAARTPWATSTFGLGQVIERAAQQADALLIGLGGSSTHDLALGALAALGARFFDREDQPMTELPVPDNWPKIARIELPSLPALPIRIACDVDNPLVGPHGAAAIFGPQKGLEPTRVEELDCSTHRIAILLAHAANMGTQILSAPGTGAAGGAAFGLMASLGGKLISGATLVFDWVDLPSKLEAADIVITGEGRFDASSLNGKGPGSLVQLSQTAGKLSFILAGSLGDLPDTILTSCQCVAITPRDTPLEQALAQGAANLEQTVRDLFAVDAVSQSSI